MGNNGSSYLTITNDTEYPWHCKLEKHEEYGWNKIASAVLENFTKILVANQLVVSHLIQMADPSGTGPNIVEYNIFNVPDNAFKPLFEKGPDSPGVVVGGADLTGAVQPLAESISKVLDQNGFTLLKKGQRQQYGPFKLSSTAYATCKQIIPQGVAVIKTIRLNGIKSGKAKDTIRNHNIQYWIDDRSSQDELINMKSGPPPKRRGLEVDDTPLYNTTIS